MISIAAQIDNLKKRLTKKILDSLLVVMKDDLIPKIVDNLMRVYDEELVANELKDDPARPSVARQAFKGSIEKSLTETLELRSNKISLSVGDISELKLDDATIQHLGEVDRNANPLEWLVFYIDGFIGEFAFVSEDTFKKLNSAGLVSDKSFSKFPTWGWYGQGFLVPREAYLDKGYDKVVPFSQVRHPFSGSRPVPLFERAMENIDFKSMVAKAIERALR